MSTLLAINSIVPAPHESALLGFLARIPPGACYAIYPMGRYSRAALEDLPPGALDADGRSCIGFIDDSAADEQAWDRPIATLEHAARNWELDAIVLTRDTHDTALRRRIDALQREGLLPRTLIVDRPLPTLNSMLAHLGSYSPSCKYEPRFIGECRTSSNALRLAHTTIALTLDAERFPYAAEIDGPLYAEVMREFCAVLAGCGASATLCVQIQDSSGQMRATPPEVVYAFLDQFGPESVALHGINHDMPSDGYSADWLEQGLAQLRAQYGVETRYWAPPGWTCSWRTLRVLRKTAIRYVRGIWTGVNLRQQDWPETFRAPYRIQSGLWQIPYCYVDWMFNDLQGRRCDWEAIMPAHKALASFAARGPCLVESVAHPFRMVGPDWRERLAIVRDTLEMMTAQGVQVGGVEQCLALQSDN